MEQTDNRINSLSKLYSVLPNILFFLTRLPVKLFFKIFLNLEIIGKEHLKNLPKGIIIAANHTNELDPVVLTFIFPIFSKHLPLFFVVLPYDKYDWKGWKKYLYISFFSRAWGAYPVDTGSGDYEIALKSHIEILENNHSVCVFPEGRRSKDGSHGEPRGGVGYLSFKTNKPIIPVAISGLYDLSFSKILLRKAKLKIEIFPAIYRDSLFKYENDTDYSLNSINQFKNAAKKVMCVISKNSII